MNAAIDILVVHDGALNEEVMRALLSSAPDTELRIVGYLERLGSHMADADVLIVACGTYSEDAGALISEAVEDRPDRPVVLVTEGAPNGYVDHAFVAGAVTVIPAATLAWQRRSRTRSASRSARLWPGSPAPLRRVRAG